MAEYYYLVTVPDELPPSIEAFDNKTQLAEALQKLVGRQVTVYMVRGERLFTSIDKASRKCLLEPGHLPMPLTPAEGNHEPDSSGRMADDPIPDADYTAITPKPSESKEDDDEDDPEEDDDDKEPLA